MKAEESLHLPSMLENKATEYLKADGNSTAVLVLNLRF
jgi:hypothetical protein